MGLDNQVLCSSLEKITSLAHSISYLLEVWSVGWRSYGFCCLLWHVYYWNPCTVHVWVVLLVRLYECSFWNYKQTFFSLIIWLWPSFCPILWQHFQRFGTGIVCRSVNWHWAPQFWIFIDCVHCLLQTVFLRKYKD